MDEFSGGRTLVYKSDNIYERRRRILRETRRMIAESGLDGFNVRELCVRAGVAQKTLYNAFGSREGVVAMSIRQYMEDFIERADYRHAPTSLEGRLERLIKVHSRNLQIRPYTSAIMAVYNSPTADAALREAIRNVSPTGHRMFAQSLRARRALAPGVTEEILAYNVSTAIYAVLTNWCLGDLEDSQLVDRVAEAVLTVTFAATRGAVHAEARVWLQRVRERQQPWLDLRLVAEALPGPAGEPAAPESSA